MPKTKAQPTQTHCNFCDRVTEKSRLPSGWKRHQEQVYCDRCWNSHYMMRAVTIPIASPIGIEWPEFREVLAKCWAKSTALANWAATELAKHDTIRQPDMERLGKMPTVYLYGLAAESYSGWSDWEGACSSAQCLLRSVEQKYRKSRLDLVWRRSISLPTHKYPFPYPVHNQSWAAAWLETEGENGQKVRVPTVTFNLGGQRISFRLRGGHGFRRQLGAFSKIVSGEAIAGELAIYRVRASAGDNRNGTTDRRAGGGSKVSYRIMCKIAAWLPKPLGQNQEERNGVLQVCTSKNAFLVASKEDSGRPWILRDNQVRRWVRSHRWKLDHISDDTKAERRRPKRRRVQMNDHLDQLTAKHHARMDDYCHRASKMLVGYADRNRIAEIVYNDDEKEYLPEFPWFKLKTLIQQKSEELGITFRPAGGKQEENGDA